MKRLDIEQQRKAFEEAFKKQHSGVSFWLNTWDEDEQSYRHLTAAWAWTMWLAAQKQEGYVMVPVEPTQDMLRAGEISHAGYDNIDAKEVYKVMIQAAQE